MRRLPKTAWVDPPCFIFLANTLEFLPPITTLNEGVGVHPRAVRARWRGGDWVSNKTGDRDHPYRVDAEWNRAVFARRTGRVAEFLAPHLRAGARLLDCGCGPGSITVDLAETVAPGGVVGIDIRDDALQQGRSLAHERGVANVTFHKASAYQLPFREGSFDAVFACAVLQHLRAPGAALEEIRRVLVPGGVVGVVDGSSPVTFRSPTSPLLDKWDRLRALEREHNAGRPSDALHLRTLLREAGFVRTRGSAAMATEAGPPAGSPEEIRDVARHHLIRLRGVLGKLALAEGWATTRELEQIADALNEWGNAPDAIYARPVFTAIGWK